MSSNPAVLAERLLIKEVVGNCATKRRTARVIGLVFPTYGYRDDILTLT